MRLAGARVGRPAPESHQHRYRVAAWGYLSQSAAAAAIKRCASGSW
jgi:hypothetical protein